MWLIFQNRTDLEVLLSRQCWSTRDLRRYCVALWISASADTANPLGAWTRFGPFASHPRATQCWSPRTRRRWFQWNETWPPVRFGLKFRKRRANHEEQKSDWREQNSGDLQIGLKCKPIRSLSKEPSNFSFHLLKLSSSCKTGGFVFFHGWFKQRAKEFTLSFCYSPRNARKKSQFLCCI